MYAKNLSEIIGNTPLLKINYLSRNAEILAKCEFLNPSHSVKDRVASFMIHSALENGDINENTLIIEPTSGNTGIGLASICASLKLKLVLTMPESMSIERRKILEFLGAKLVLTSAKEGMSGAVREAEKIAKETKNSFMPRQFSNPLNQEAHFKTTGVEIYNQSGGDIDFFISAVGTGGTLTGVGRYLKSKNKNTKIIAVEPSTSAVLSGKQAGSHGIQGIGAGFVPEVLDTKLYDDIIQISTKDAIEEAKALAKNEGIMAGISSGANLYASKLIAEKYPKTKIVTILCDTASRYLSTELFNKDL